MAKTWTRRVPPGLPAAALFALLSSPVAFKIPGPRDPAGLVAAMERAT